MKDSWHFDLEVNGFESFPFWFDFCAFLAGVSHTDFFTGTSSVSSSSKLLSSLSSLSSLAANHLETGYTVVWLESSWLFLVCFQIVSDCFNYFRWFWRKHCLLFILPIFLFPNGLLEKEMATHSSILSWRIPMERGAWWARVHGVTKRGTDWVTKYIGYHRGILPERQKISDGLLSLVTQSCLTLWN